MGQERNHAAGQLALLALAHVLDLLGNVLPVQQFELARPDQPGLLVGSGHHVLLVASAHLSTSGIMDLNILWRAPLLGHQARWG
jgi:hypothetical protein